MNFKFIDILRNLLITIINYRIFKKMSTAKLEYIWLDGYVPTQNMRSKTKILRDFDGKLESCPVWAFDGSSTQQAEGGSSDCLLKPVAIFPDPTRENGFLVMTEVLNPDGSPHASNGRATIDDDDDDFWFGFEQEYFIMDTETDLPLGFPPGGYPGPQGLYYCSVGGKNTHGRQLVEDHADICLLLYRNCGNYLPPFQRKILGRQRLSPHGVASASCRKRSR